MHLLFPFVASLLYVTGILFVKRAADLGVGAWRTSFVTNLLTGLVFSSLWLLGGTWPGWSLIWQPALMALFFVTGQTLSFVAVSRGDVSIATPIMGIKIILVALLAAMLFREPISTTLWLAAGLSTLSLALLGYSGNQPHHHMAFTITTSALASLAFAAFDVLVSQWSPAWGPGRLLPVLMGFVALYSLAFLPLFKGPISKVPLPAWKPLLLGAAFITLQAVAIVSGLALHGDAAAMNVVYSCRGLWSVAAVWLVGHWFDNREQNLAPSVLRMRLAGAALLTFAIVLVFV